MKLGHAFGEKDLGGDPGVLVDLHPIYVVVVVRVDHNHQFGQLPNPECSRAYDYPQKESAP